MMHTVQQFILGALPFVALGVTIAVLAAKKDDMKPTAIDKLHALSLILCGISGLVCLLGGIESDWLKRVLGALTLVSVAVLAFTSVKKINILKEKKENENHEEE